MREPARVAASSTACAGSRSINAGRANASVTGAAPTTEATNATAKPNATRTANPLRNT
jgi:hypothetical protein